MSFKRIISEISEEVSSFDNESEIQEHIDRKFNISIHNFQMNLEDNIHYLTCRNSYTVMKALKKNAKGKKGK